MAFLQNLIKSSNFNRILTSTTTPISSVFGTQNEIFTTQKRFAARKGKRIAATREKQKLAKIRREEMKNAPPKVWKPNKMILDKKANLVSKKFNDDDRRDFSEICDNVYILNLYKERKNSFYDTLQMIRETHDPTMFDEPNALLEAKVELDMRTKKKTKFVEKFRGIISYQNGFEYTNKRKVVAICKTDEDVEIAKAAGAEIAGSSDLIIMLKGGEITMENFDDLVCHGDMLIELAAIKSSVGRFFPTKQRGNIGFDMNRLVKHFVNGLEFKAVKDGIENDYGYVRLPFGRLSQSDKQLLENFEVVLEAVEQNKAVGVTHDFIRRVLLVSEPCPELFPVSFWDNISNYDNPYAVAEDDDEDGADENVKISAKN